MIGALIPQSVKVVAFTLGGIVAAVGVTLLYAQIFMLPGAERDGREKAVAAQAVKDGKAELERKGDDATLQIRTDFELCVLGLRGNGMPTDACEQLRGVPQE